MVKRGPTPPPEERIINETMSEALSKRYLAYALSTITARALPDVRDGLIVMTGGRHRAFEEWKSWRGQRAQAGKVVPKGFPKGGTFSG